MASIPIILQKYGTYLAHDLFRYFSLFKGNYFLGSQVADRYRHYTNNNNAFNTICEITLGTLKLFNIQ